MNSQDFLNTLGSDYESKYGFHDSSKPVMSTKPGLSEDVVREISRIKNEPEWLLDFRLKALKIFNSKKMPEWGSDLSGIDFNKITYYLKPSDRTEKRWEDVPEDIKKTFDRLGIPEAEKKFLSGVGAQYESEMVYHSLRRDMEKQGVIFVDPNTALTKHEDLFRKFFGTVVPAGDNKFAALNSAVFSGGSFIYVPENVTVDVPLQAYFRINATEMGQFERTLIIADKGSVVNYLEGCSAPIYSRDSLHSAVVELVALEDAKIRYTTIQNWSTNVYNLVTKRAHAYRNARVEWIDANLGSKLTMKYPSVYLMEPGASGDILSIAFAGKNQIQDTGGKIIHFAPDTKSNIISKSISKNGGYTLYRGLVKILNGASGSQSNVRCDALILDNKSRSDTFPHIKIDENDVTAAHEATVGKISEENIFYLMSRGLKESEAITLIVLGFIEGFTKALPMEYAIELNRLIQLEMEGAVG
ncbi:MAG: Fe-S cluster assembly protein SufB [Candidatus Aenigmarchaeota archaeon]|nr:Fe-S cluster assembly protein SufB [Candidatus Aenigmarchaeota archaeon]